MSVYTNRYTAHARTTACELDGVEHIAELWTLNANRMQTTKILTMMIKELFSVMAPAKPIIDTRIMNIPIAIKSPAAARKRCDCCETTNPMMRHTSLSPINQAPIAINSRPDNCTHIYMYANIKGSVEEPDNSNFCRFGKTRFKVSNFFGM